MPKAHSRHYRNLTQRPDEVSSYEFTYVAYWDLLRSPIRFGGRVVRVADLSEAEFRDWFYAVIELVMPRVDTKLKHKISAVKNDASTQRMDEDARWYYLNELYRLPKVRNSGVELFVRQESEDRAS